MFTPIKSAVTGVLNETVLNTPQPQAASTAQRKSTYVLRRPNPVLLESRFNIVDFNTEKHEQIAPCNSEVVHREADSSLGLLDNMSVLTNIGVTDEDQRMNCSNTDAELEFARKLLRRCSDLRTFSQSRDMNKENNANMQNITSISPVSNSASLKDVYIPDQEQECDTNSSLNKFSTANIMSESNEITALSSGIGRNAKDQSMSNKSGGISFSTSTAEIMAQFNNEEFLSGSQMIEKLSADEAFWKQNYTYSMPVTNTGKHELDLTSFSGIIGQLDLSIESCTGKKVSVGQYFKRKCGNIGVMGDDERVKTSFNFATDTPMKGNNLVPLVDSTIMTNATTLSVDSKGKDRMHISDISDMTIDADENNILSLSTIARTLANVDVETSRQVLDELLMAQKRKKYPVGEDNTKRETHTLPLEKNSVVTTHTMNSSKFDEDINLVNLATKLSFDSEIQNKDIDTKQQFSRMLSLTSNINLQETDSFVSICKEKMKADESDKNMTASCKQGTVGMLLPDIKLFSQNSVLPVSSDNKVDDFSCIPCKADIKSCGEKSYNNTSIQDIQTKEIIKEDISTNTIASSCMENRNTQMQRDLYSDVIISKNTQQLCNCIVGMTCEANIELINKGDRWITYSLELNEIRGDKQSIALNIPQDAILIKPNGTQSTKIEVKVTKMCSPIIAVLNIIVSDMVAKSKWLMKHMICFKPEELELDVICDSDNQELNFQYITDNSTKALPIILHNKNNIDVPVKLSILQDEPKMFSIEGTFNGSVKLKESHDELAHIILKSQHKFTARIKCKGLHSYKSASEDYSPLQYWNSKLVIHVQRSDGVILLTKEVPLHAQAGICKIEVVDTDIPIIVPRQGKLLNIINSGNIATHVTATVVPLEGYPDATQDFSMKPENILLQPEEKGSFLIVYKSQIPDTEMIDDERHAKIKLAAGNNVYHYWLIKAIVKQKLLTSENENYLRCDTPCNFVSINSPTSPQSVVSSRSEPYGRNSPSSTVSSVPVTGNIIPIRATHSALVWNSVKTGKSEIKEFTIRNTSNNKIKIQVDILDDSKSFKFLGNRQTINTSMVLVMQRAETKTLAVMFSPYHVGPVAGKITIRHYTPAKESNEFQQHKWIPLYGYGGYAKVKILDAFKDTNGKVWLSLGTLFSGTTKLRANIKLQNTGDLRSFAKIKVVPKVISPTMDTDWQINPKELILNPKETRGISIEFHPKKEDFAILQHSDVSHVATVNVTYGDEPTRWRIRRLYNKMKETGGLSGSENEAFKSIVHPICKTFPQEQLIPGLTSIRDSVQNLSDLCTGVQQSEIMLTVEACADDTLPILPDTDDESQMYYSLISDNSHINEVGGASFFASQTIDGYEVPHQESQDNFIVTPSTVILNPPVCNEATVTVVSFFKVAQPFQTRLSNSNHFNVSPAEGILPSKKTFFLKIRCSQRIEQNMQAVLEIYTENNRQDVLIKVNAKRH